jgi:hypothetical protein
MFPFSIVDCVRRIETLFDQPCECRDGVISLHRHRAPNGHNGRVLAIENFVRRHAYATMLHFCRILVSWSQCWAGAAKRDSPNERMAEVRTPEIFKMSVIKSD